MCLEKTIPICFYLPLILAPCNLSNWVWDPVAPTGGSQVQHFSLLSFTSKFPQLKLGLKNIQNYWHRRGIYSGSVPYKDFGLKAPKYWLGRRPIYSQVYIQQEYYSRGGGGCRSKIYAPLENIYALYGFWTNFFIFGPILTQKCNLEPQYC